MITTAEVGSRKFQDGSPLHYRENPIKNLPSVYEADSLASGTAATARNREPQTLASAGS